jgi:multidrug efflux pump subunit AcrA (membrane-fusion protein)
MKKYFYLALGGVFAFIFGLIFYGAYINHSDEVKIAESMATRHAILIKGAKATVRQIYPQIVISGADIFSKEKTDAVAMIDGRITSVNVVRNDNVTEGQTLFVLKNESYPVKIRQAESEILKAESEILKADNEIIKAETALANAKHELERYTRLLERVKLYGNYSRQRLLQRSCRKIFRRQRIFCQTL